MIRRKELPVQNDHHEIASLDVLRGLAILSVILAHFMPASFPYERQASLAFANGGVILFFFLSGFLMDRNLAIDPAPIPYAIRRAFRILPMYWLSIVIVMILEPRWSVTDALANATFAAPLTGTERMSGVYWTLYIEVFFYCLAPILRYLGERAIALTPYAFIAALAAVWMVRSAPPASIFYLVFCFAGMQFGAWHRHQIKLSTLTMTTVFVALAASTFPVASIYLGVAPLICGALLWAALRFRRRNQALESTGAVSYSWYLLHPTIGYLAMEADSRLGATDWLAAMTGAGVSLALSALTFAFYERPAIAIGRKIVRSMRSDKIGAAR